MRSQEFPQTPLRLILTFLKPHRAYFLGLLLISLLWAIDVSLRPYLIKLMLDTLQISQSDSVNLFLALKDPVILYIGLNLFMNLTNRVYDYFSLKIMPVFNKNIVVGITKYIQKHSHTYFQNHFGGSIVSKISTAADAAEDILESVIHHFFQPLLTFIISAYAMYLVYPPLAIILIVWTLLFIGISYLLSRHVHVLSQELSESSTALVGKLIDSITNILAVRLFARRKYEVKFLTSSLKERSEKAQELRWSDLKRQAVMEGMANILVVILLYYIINERQKNNISIGDFALVLALSISIIDILWNISRNYIRFIEDVGKCSQALKILTVAHQIVDIKNAQSLRLTKGQIEFKNVTFCYPKSKPLFENISFIIKGGEKIGVVGYSGSGKTTLANLLVRLYDVDAGAITIDNQNIKEVSQKSLHNNISFIPQDSMLFHRTILENLKYGKIDATDEEINAAALKARADEFIKSLPHGYKTVVGERGAKLSGGQRQRLAIARAILKNSKILILDEATSALDTLTEHYIQESLDILMQNKTVIVIAHRLSTLLKMDKILVFKEGKIVEQGSHKELLSHKGAYAQLWNMQADNQSTSIT
jgi:ATP-binding cassette subfamily B protein